MSGRASKRLSQGFSQVGALAMRTDAEPEFPLQPDPESSVSVEFIVQTA